MASPPHPQLPHSQYPLARVCRLMSLELHVVILHDAWSRPPRESVACGPWESLGAISVGSRSVAGAPWHMSRLAVGRRRTLADGRMFPGGGGGGRSGEGFCACGPRPRLGPPGPSHAEQLLLSVLLRSARPERARNRARRSASGARACAPRLSSLGVARARGSWGRRMGAPRPVARMSDGPPGPGPTNTHKGTEDKL